MIIKIIHLLRIFIYLKKNKLNFKLLGFGYEITIKLPLNIVLNLFQSFIITRCQTSFELFLLKIVYKSQTFSFGFYLKDFLSQVFFA